MKKLDGPVTDAERAGQSIKETTRIQGYSAAIRSFICGYVDAYSLLTFGVYASFMTGNTTTAGVRTAQSMWTAAGHSLLPIPFFMLGIFLGTFAHHLEQSRGLARISVLVSVLLILDVIIAYVAWPSSLSVMILSCAMGLLNTTVTAVGAQAVSLGFMTGDLNNLAKQLAGWFRGEAIERAQGSWDTSMRRALVLVSLWVAFFTGAIVGALISPSFGPRMLLLPALTLLILVFIERVIGIAF